MNFQVSNINKLGSYLITGIVLDMVLVHNPVGLSCCLRTRTTTVESQKLFGASKAISSFDLRVSTSNCPVPCFCFSVGTVTLPVLVLRFIEKVPNLILCLSF